AGAGLCLARPHGKLGQAARHVECELAVARRAGGAKPAVQAEVALALTEFRDPYIIWCEPSRRAGARDEPLSHRTCGLAIGHADQHALAMLLRPAQRRHETGEDARLVVLHLDQ